VHGIFLCVGIGWDGVRWAGCSGEWLFHLAPHQVGAPPPQVGAPPPQVGAPPPQVGRPTTTVAPQVREGGAR